MDLDAAVVEAGLGGDDGEALSEGLGYEQAVEGVAVGQGMVADLVDLVSFVHLAP